MGLLEERNQLTKKSFNFVIAAKLRFLNLVYCLHE